MYPKSVTKNAIVKYPASTLIAMETDKNKDNINDDIINMYNLVDKLYCGGCQGRWCCRINDAVVPFELLVLLGDAIILDISLPTLLSL